MVEKKDDPFGWADGAAPMAATPAAVVVDADDTAVAAVGPEPGVGVDRALLLLKAKPRKEADEAEEAGDAPALGDGPALGGSGGAWPLDPSEGIDCDRSLLDKDAKLGAPNTFLEEVDGLASSKVPDRVAGLVIDDRLCMTSVACTASFRIGNVASERTDFIVEFIDAYAVAADPPRTPRCGATLPV